MIFQETYTKAEKFAEWDALGEDAVRTSYELGRFGGEKKALAKMWLDAKAQERSEASNSESLRIARSAKNAAWAAAIAAIIAAICAVIAIVSP